MIPEDWVVKKLGDIAKIYRGASPRPIEDPKWFNEYSNIGWVRISDVTKSVKYLFNTTQHLSEQGVKQSRFVKQENLIMSICATVGKPIITKKDVCIHDGFVIFERPKIKIEYLYYFLSSIEDNWSKNGQTGSQMNLNTTIIENEYISFPNSLEEQQAISTALSDVDALITSLDKLIVKKCDIKQATMLQLLTGKTRLTGFSGEWGVKKISEILRVRYGKSQQGVAVSDGIYPILATGGEIGRTNEQLYNKPSVLIGRKGTIDSPQYADAPFWAIDTIFYTEVSDNNHPKFVFYLFNIINWLQYNEASGVPSLNATTIESIEVQCPPFPEQQAISTVLSDMDAEITTLEQKRDKIRALKQGMMQELLTGKTRLL